MKDMGDVGKGGVPAPLWAGGAPAWACSPMEWISCWGRGHRKWGDLSPR